MAELISLTLSKILALIVLIIIMHFLARSIRLKNKDLSAAISVVVTLYVINVFYNALAYHLPLPVQGVIFLILSFGLNTLLIKYFYKENWLRSFFAAILLSILSYLILLAVQAIGLVLAAL